MSKKPLKHSEQKTLEKDLKEKAARRSRRTEEVPEFPPYTIIFCEGTKTEPHYLQEIVDCIMEKYKKYAMNNHIKMSKVVQIEGVGQSCKSLFEYAKRNAPDSVEVVWPAYDKDDFPSEYFDVTPDLAVAETNKGRQKYYAAWSNECIELWFLLHFQDLVANVRRPIYRKKL